ncbi:MAG: hypothetical protein ACJAV5_000292 [Vicingaceae bacterium]|jgi:hypothetical protein
MNVNSDIQRKKETFNLPYDEDQLEYWGPINTIFADSFLTMGHTFIYQYFNTLDSKRLKAVFSSLVGMVQNMSAYAENSYEDVHHQVFIRVRDGGQHVLITTANRISLKDKLSLQTIFENKFAIPEAELEAEYRNMLFNGGGLGLIMLRKLKDATLEYSFSEKQEGEIWLGIELKMNYGNT